MSVVKIARAGKSAESTDPNDFIFHSDYNTFKIIKTAEAEITVNAGVSNQDYTIPHGLPFIPFVNAFAKENGVDQVIAPNDENITGVFFTGMGYFTTDLKFNSVSADATNIIVNFSNASGSNKTVKIRYFCLEGLDNGVANFPEPEVRPKLLVAKDGIDALIERDPRRFKFHSNYGTLKYYTKIPSSLLLIGGRLAAQTTITHDLNYYPYVEVYVKNPTGEYEYSPSHNGGATVVYSTLYAITKTQLKLFVTTSGFFADQVFDFLIFFFRNDLGFA